jgi:hypothetical protein
MDPEKAVIQFENVNQATREPAKTKLRFLARQHELDQMLAGRRSTAVPPVFTELRSLLGPREMQRGKTGMMLQREPERDLVEPRP